MFRKLISVPLPKASDRARPAHGQQQLVLFHGHYGQYQYQPRVITCAENDMVVMPCLLYGSAPAALGAADDHDVTLLQRVALYVAG